MKEYVQEQKSTQVIAHEHDTYAKRITRALKYHGIPTRTREEAQQLALQQGRSKHPSEGQGVSQEKRQRIGEGVSRAWARKPQEAVDLFVSNSRKRWEQIPEEVKQEMQSKAARGLLRSSREGSRLEKYFMLALRTAGFHPEWHREYLIEGNAGSHVDIYLPDEGIAIEVDGPTHFLPIRGEERLAEVADNDQTKTGLLLQSGHKVLRFRHMGDSRSETHMRKAAERLLEAIADLAKKAEPEVLLVDFTTKVEE